MSVRENRSYSEKEDNFMTQLDDVQIQLLTRALETDFIPHLPILLDLTKPIEEQKRKNLSRALSAFVLRSIVGISPSEAAAAVVDGAPVAIDSSVPGERATGDAKGA